MRLRTLTCCCLMLLVPCSVWPQSAASPAEVQGPAQFPEKLLSARRAYLLAVAAEKQPGGTAFVPTNLVAKPLAQQQLAKAMEKWRRFEIVDDVSKADLMLVVVEWEDHHRWGNTTVCRDQLFVYEGGVPSDDKSHPLWQGDPERWGKFGECSGAGEPVKELRKEIEKADKASR